MRRPGGARHAAATLARRAESPAASRRGVALTLGVTSSWSRHIYAPSRPPPRRAGPCGTIRAPGPIRATGSGRPGAGRKRLQHDPAQHALGRPGPLSQRRAAAERDLPQVRRPDGPVPGRRREARHARSTSGRSISIWPAPAGVRARNSAARAARRSPSDGRPMDWLCPSHPENSGSRWTAWWKWPASTPSTACTSTTSAIPTAPLLLRRLPQAVRGRLAAAGGQLARRTAIRPAEGGIQRLAMPADHAPGGGRAPRGEEDPARHQDLGRGFRRLSRLPPRRSPRTGRPGSRPDTSTSFVPWTIPQSDKEFAGLVREQVKLVEGRVPIYPGIGATASNSALSADRVVGQIHSARNLGAAGFCIFNFDHGTAVSIVPGVGLGVGRLPAVPPHRSEPTVK